MMIDGDQRKKNNAFRATKDIEEELDDEETGVLTRKFKQLLYKNINGRRGDFSNQNATDMMCFKCKKPGHIKLTVLF